MIANVSLPVLDKDAYAATWRRIAGALAPGGRVAAMLSGDRDGWAADPAMTCPSPDWIRELLAGFTLQHWEDREEERATAQGEPRHGTWSTSSHGGPGAVIAPKGPAWQGRASPHPRSRSIAMPPLPRPAPIPLPEDDDTPVGRVLSRREVLALVGASGAVLATGMRFMPALAQDAAASPEAGASALPSCIVRPALTEGPLFVDLRLDRSDIRLDTDGSMVEGTPLALAFQVSRIDGAGCTPFAGATVDVWHCDADGIYSAVNTMGMETSDQIYLRGYQVTDANGTAAFTTIVPGWYSGRAVHIHFKIRTFADEQTTWDFTSQLFFDEAWLANAYAVEPYAARGPADVPNARDGIYQGGGDQLLLTPAAGGDGYTVVFPIGLQMS